jgi:hypothetical protein
MPRPGGRVGLGGLAGGCGETMRNLTCESCGAEYEVTEHPVATGHQESFTCDCGNTLVQGQDVALYTLKLIKLGEEPDRAEPGGAG